MFVGELQVSPVLGLERVQLFLNKRLIFIYIKTVIVKVLLQFANSDQVELFVLALEKKRLGSDLLEGERQI